MAVLKTATKSTWSEGKCLEYIERIKCDSLLTHLWRGNKNRFLLRKTKHYGIKWKLIALQRAICYHLLYLAFLFLLFPVYTNGGGLSRQMALLQLAYILASVPVRRISSFRRWNGCATPVHVNRMYSCSNILWSLPLLSPSGYPFERSKDFCSHNCRPRVISVILSKKTSGKALAGAASQRQELTEPREHLGMTFSTKIRRSRERVLAFLECDNSSMNLWHIAHPHGRRGRVCEARFCTEL